MRAGWRSECQRCAEPPQRQTTAGGSRGLEGAIQQVGAITLDVCDYSFSFFNTSYLSFLYFIAILFTLHSCSWRHVTPRKL